MARSPRQEDFNHAKGHASHHANGQLSHINHRDNYPTLPLPPSPSPTPPPPPEAQPEVLQWKPDFNLTAKIPKLKGESNLGAWKSLVLSVTYTHDIDEYIERSVPPPNNVKASPQYARWKYERGSMTVMLRDSLMEVRDKLRTAGLSDGEMDPFVIYTKVCQTIPRDSECSIGDLMLRFANRGRANFDSLESFQEEHQYLRCRMQELGVCPPDKFMIFCTLKKLEDAMPRAYPFLERDFEAGILDWNELMQAITRETRRDKVQTAPTIAAPRTTVQSSSNSKQTPSDWAIVFKVLPKLENVNKGLLKSLDWCQEYEGFKWKGYSHHPKEKGCGKCHEFKKCFEWGKGRNKTNKNSNNSNCSSRK